MKRLRLGVVLLALAILVACGGGNSNTRMRTLHASPDSGGVDVEIDSSRIATNVRYLGTSDYQRIGRGQHTIDVFVSGTNVFNNDVELSGNTDYTFVLAGFRGSLFPALLTDDNSAPPSGQIKLRFLHLSPNAGAVDVYALGSGADINTSAPQFPTARFGVTGGYTVLPAGTYDLRITSAGAKDNIVETGPIGFSAGQVRTLVFANAPSGSATPFTAVMLADAN